MPAKTLFFPLILVFFYSCQSQDKHIVANKKDTIPVAELPAIQQSNPEGIRTIHVFVALCDNKYQGIVPVPASIGNGQDAKNNLYWGAGFGIKAFFTKSKEWELISTSKNVSESILERLLFRHRSNNVYMLADAYDGKFIRETMVDFLRASSGQLILPVEKDRGTIFFGGAADLVSYIGHDGLMDFSVNEKFEGNNSKLKETIVLACYSKKFFSPHLKSTGANPLLWTSGLMAPEAYTLHDAISEWIKGSSPEKIRMAAATAYSKYQKCSYKAARNLLVQGW